MSTEAELAKLTLKLLLDKPDELQEVLVDFGSSAMEYVTALQEGSAPSPTERRTKLLQEYKEKYGAPVLSAVTAEKADIKTLERELSSRLSGLPAGATFKIG